MEPKGSSMDLGSENRAAAIVLERSKRNVGSRENIVYDESWPTDAYETRLSQLNKQIERNL